MTKAVTKFKVPKEDITLVQDEDVLDTWFSSGLFPFSTMGWPDEKHLDFQAFFPNQILETGHDIIFFWVARMVMMSLLLTKKLPFTDVYLHPIIRDAGKPSRACGHAAPFLTASPCSSAASCPCSLAFPPPSLQQQLDISPCLQSHGKRFAGAPLPLALCLCHREHKALAKRSLCVSPPSCVGDSDGKKMSKSLGNVVDPLEIIDGCPLQTLIEKLDQGNLDPKELTRAKALKNKEYPEGFPQCGSDALRFGLLSYMMQGRFINFDIKRIISHREFCNKIWQTIRFGLLMFPKDFKYQENQFAFKNMHFINKWILTKLNKAIKGVNDNFDKYYFGDATIV